jgi:cysteine desulfurase
VQVIGKLPVDLARLEVDALTMTAHKFHGPAGIGALFVRRGVRLEPILFGGHQQQGLRPGTESVALAVGMHVALQLWDGEWEQRIRRMRSARDELEQQVCRQDAGVVVNGEEPRLPHATNLSFVGLERQALWMALDLAGVQCSTGSACASGASDPSHVLQAMGLDSSRIDSAVRLSVGATTTASDVAQAVSRILSTVHHLRRQNSLANSLSSARETQPEGI